jgi:hypothetical protein
LSNKGAIKWDECYLCGRERERERDRGRIKRKGMKKIWQRDKVTTAKVCCDDDDVLVRRCFRKQIRTEKETETESINQSINRRIMYYM